jgi:tetratricopeptide (TPR) repeat protein
MSTTSAKTVEVVLDPDALARLEEERDFLRRSLDDLEHERDAGDIDDRDYATLRDDYRARLAATEASIAAGRVAVTVGRPHARRIVAAAVVIVIGLLAGVLVAQSSGRRDPGELSSGNIRDTVRGRLTEARRAFQGGDAARAVTLYDALLEDEPANIEAMTYRAWAYYVGSDRTRTPVCYSLAALVAATTAEPSYPDAHAFIAVLLDRLGRPASALRELDKLAALDPSPEITDNVGPLRERIEGELATTSTSPAGGVTTTTTFACT